MPRFGVLRSLIVITSFAGFVDVTTLAGTLPAPSISPVVTTAYADGMTAGPDGNVWLVDRSKNLVGRMGAAPPFPLTTFAVPTPSSSLQSITAGTDGNLWFTEGKRVGRITTQGVITEFPVSASSSLTVIKPGPDGALWFVDGGFFSGATKIGRIAVDGTINEFSVGGGSDNILDLTGGGDGNIWFINSTSNSVSKLSTTGTLLGTYTIPSAEAGNIADQMVLGLDGNIWFTHGSSIDRIKSDGTITEYKINTSGGAPSGIAIGADGNIWFAEYRSGQIGQLIVSTADDSGTATINESNLDISFAILQARKLFILPTSPQPSATAVRPAADHCPPTAFLVNTSASGVDNMSVVQVDQPTTCADLVVQTIDFREVRKDQSWQVFATIANNGPDDAEDTTVTMTLGEHPPILEARIVHSARGCNTSTNANTIICTFDLYAGSVDSLEVYMPAGILKPFAVIVNVHSSLPDPNPANNQQSGFIDPSVVGFVPDIPDQPPATPPVKRH